MASSLLFFPFLLFTFLFFLFWIMVWFLRKRGLEKHTYYLYLDPQMNFQMSVVSLWDIIFLCSHFDDKHTLQTNWLPFQVFPEAPSGLLICYSDSQNLGKHYIYNYSFITLKVYANQNQGKEETHRENLRRFWTWSFCVLRDMVLSLTIHRVSQPGRFTIVVGVQNFDYGSITYHPHGQLLVSSTPARTLLPKV